jgi:hypothetical protein
MKRIAAGARGIVQKRPSTHGPDSATTTDETVPEIRAKLAHKPKAPPLSTEESVNQLASKIQSTRDHH